MITNPNCSIRVRRMYTINEMVFNRKTFKRVNEN